MRSVLIIGLFAISLANPAWGDYAEERELTLDTRGIDTLSVENHSGSIDIVGVPESNEIVVKAIIQVQGRNDEKARKKIANNLVLTLESGSDVAILKGYFEKSGIFNSTAGESVQLQIRMPERMHLDIDDGSGSIEVTGVHGDIVLDDGSGSVTLSDVGGNIAIDDGSGSISVHEVGGDISVRDGSGSIEIRGVAGSVTIDDGSGSIKVSDVEKDLIIVDDGSGGLSFSNIAGRVEAET